MGLITDKTEILDIIRAYNKGGDLFERSNW